MVELGVSASANSFECAKEDRVGWGWGWLVLVLVKVKEVSLELGRVGLG